MCCRPCRLTEAPYVCDILGAWAAVNGGAALACNDSDLYAATPPLN